LPAPEEQEAVSAYYFYRLIQRAKQVTLVYSTKNDGLRTGEASRYVLQLKMESGHAITEQTLHVDVEIPENKPISIDKQSHTPEGVPVREALERYFYAPANDDSQTKTASLSPSALNAYLACPLRFYFRYLARLNEPKEVTEQVDARLFGTLLHKSMELIYEQWIGKEITSAIIDNWLNAPDFIQNNVQQAIAKEFYKSESLPAAFRENGDLLMINDIICQYIRQLLLIDKKQAPFVPEGMEVKVNQLFSFTANGQPQQLLLSGIIDRLHRKDADYYVVDYKTGRTDNAFESLDALFGDDRAKRHDGILQILLYSTIIHDSKKQKVIPLLYFLRESHSDDADVTIWNKADKIAITDASIYTEELTQLVTNTLNILFDYTQPFVQTTDVKNCEYCAYKAICRK
jgi:ATP-dependent helicase/DNAse subunit B